ncbi:hypothetical protein HGM15179_006950 [Zosterops borbonicus]|uniref:Uncharacterized protein n=1 Tax=Zosterops borbonicus TaxID=364589 RepID=A0A8K1GJN0_9PASS|nr:hypothetical protein HGM15179_006950 [Zosterops borbonicus]
MIFGKDLYSNDIISISFRKRAIDLVLQFSEKKYHRRSSHLPPVKLSGKQINPTASLCGCLSTLASTEQDLKWNSFIKGIETGGKEEEMTKCLAVGLTQAAKFITGIANKKIIQKVYPFLTPSGKENTERMTRGHQNWGVEKGSTGNSIVFTFSIPEHCDNTGHPSERREEKRREEKRREEKRREEERREKREERREKRREEKKREEKRKKIPPVVQK